MSTVTAYAPGRVNLIGDHTDYTFGLVLPMAIDLGITVSGERVGSVVELRSADQDEPAVVPLDAHRLDAAAMKAVRPAWARYVAGVVAELCPATGFRGTVTSTLPAGGGLSSSAALEVALALALGADPEPVGLARRCMQAEHRAGTECGIMDQLASAAGVEGHALAIDCGLETVQPVAIPAGLQIVIVDSGVTHDLSGSDADTADPDGGERRSPYQIRRDQCRDATAQIGELRDARPGDEDALHDEVLRRRARHVISENGRVRQFVVALRADDRPTLGALMVASHASLRDDFEVAVGPVNALVDELVATPGVHGARMTGGGFGGYVVALCEPGALDGRGRVVIPSAGARLLA